jgi:hypothetical protein
MFERKTVDRKQTSEDRRQMSRLRLTASVFALLGITETGCHGKQGSEDGCQMTEADF